MKVLSTLTITAIASSPQAQIGFCPPGTNLCIHAIPGLNPGEWVLQAEFLGELPSSVTAIGAIWSDVNFSLRGDAPITITDWSDGFFSPIFGEPNIIGNGSTEVSFVGVQVAFPLGTPDPSNPLDVIEFTYTGSILALKGELTGQNSALFTGDPAEPFGTILLYQDVRGDQGPLSAAFAQIPAPATLALAPLTLVAARRRRVGLFNGSTS